MTATTATTSAAAPLLNGQLIGIAYHAIAAVRDRMLAASGLTFHQSVALKAAADGLDRAGAVDRLRTTVKLGEPEIHALFDELVGAGLLDSTGTALSDKGEQVQRGFTDAVAELAERLYGDLPVAEREIAARALAHVTAKANAEFADQ
jgi:hypothetical protein